jgi:protein TonB
MPLVAPAFTASPWLRMTLESTSVAELERVLRVNHNLGHYLRVLLALLAGAVVALFTGWFMHYLIQSSDLVLEDMERVQMLDFVRLKRAEDVQRKDRKPQKPKLEQAPEVPPMPRNNANASGQQLAISAMPTDSSLDIGRGGIGFGAGEGDYLPIVKVAPIFPQRALAAGIFGQCLVRYTVTTAGTVKDVEVMKEDCTSVLYYRSSIQAAQRFKYKPRVIDGVAVEVRGVRNMFYYREMGADR